VTAEVAGAGTFGTRNDLAGTFTLAQVSPKELLAKLAPPAPVTTDPKALTALAGSGQWALRGEVVILDGLKVTLDDSKLTGSLSRTLGDPPRTRFDLTLDRIDLDRYLEPEAAAAAGAKPAADQPTELPVSLIRDLRLDGRARVGQLAYDGLQLADVDMTVAADGGRLRLDPLRTQLYGGSLAGNIVVDASGDLARVSVRQQVRDLQLGPFLTDFADVRNITGRVTANLDLAGSGATDADIKRSLDGRLSLGLADGLYKGVDLWYEIRRGRALLRQDAAPARTGEAATPLKVVELAGPVAAGVLTSEKFVAEIPFLRLAGKLRLDMPAEQIRGDLQATVFETPTFEDGTSLPDLVGSRLPLTLDGPLSSPKVRVDFSRMVKEAVKETAKEQLKGLQDKMLERLGLGAPAKPPAGDQAAPGTEPAQPVEGEPAPAEPAPKKKESSGDRLRKGLEKLIKPTE
jgi:AsmA protein